MNEAAAQVIPMSKPVGRPPVQHKIVSDSELEFYRDELTQASQVGDHLKIAQTWKNIQDFTEWPINKIAVAFKTYDAAIRKYLKLLTLPESILTAWSADQVSATVALEFVKVAPELREPLFDELKRNNFSLKQLVSKTNECFRSAKEQSKKLNERPVLTEIIAPEETLKDSPSEPVAAPAAKPGVSVSTDVRFITAICEATLWLSDSLKMSSPQIQAELNTSHDVNRALAALRHLVEHAEILQSLLRHVAEAHHIRESLLKQ